ncbi:LOW QUALITY PROTEIN: zinc finger protein kipf [Drosophila tropicalis]|uniref:LOW QUALITY PROTEIN: zinc finger protein kipf n=1 Tax=Drosophila tropicalis TaxID=46794 RepID=UPI0035ABC025
MYDKHICLDLIPEAPMICIECLDNCLQNYRFFIKLKIANLQLRELYKAKDSDLAVVPEEEPNDDINEIIVMEIPNDVQNNLEETPPQEAPESISNQDSLIVSDFLPVRQMQKGFSLYYPAVHTLDYAAVELNRDNLQEYIEANRQDSTTEYSGTSVYKCRYCPMAYASSEFLKTHMRKTHVCQYCTMSFVKVRDLNEHIRSNHSHHSCVVCKKVFVSNTNLRAHIKHLHGIQLPAQVALLDYRPGNPNENLE